MKLLNLSTILTLLLALVASCTIDAPDNTPKEYLVFGHFYGMCEGERCVELYKLTDEDLKEDTKDSYPSHDHLYEGDFEALPTRDFKEVKELWDYFPEELLDETDVVFGCPDCTDGGGLYIEYRVGSTHRYWIIDQQKANSPAYLHDFLDRVNEKISLLSEE